MEEETKAAESERRFSQAEVDNFIAKRVKSMHKRIAELEQQLAEMKQQQPESGLKESFEALRATVQKLQEERDGALVQSALLREMAQQGIPNDRHEVIERLLDRSAISVADGKVAGVGEQLAKLLEQHPFLKPAPEPPTVALNPTSPSRAEARESNLTAFKSILLGAGRSFGQGEVVFPSNLTKE